MNDNSLVLTSVSGALVLALAVVLPSPVLSPLNEQSSTVSQSIPSFHPQTWNEIRRDNIDGSHTSEFHEKFINYIDDTGRWKPIDLTPSQDSTGWHYRNGPYAADAPLKANGDIKFTSTNKYSIKEKRIRDDAPVSSIKHFTDAIPINGVSTSGGILYPNALPTIGASLLLQPHEMEYRYLVVWDSLPHQCIGHPDDTFLVPFTQQYDNGLVLTKDNGVEVKSTDETINVHLSAKLNDFRGIGIPVAHIWDSSELSKRKPVNIIARFNNSILTAAKVIDCSFFVDAVFPVETDTTSTFYPAAGENSPVDGDLVYTSATGVGKWAEAHDATDGNNGTRDTGTSFVCQSTENGGGDVEIGRFWDLFDTSSIGAGQTISAATLSWYVTSTLDQDNDGTDLINVYTTTPASNSTIVDADYDQIGSTTQGTSVDISGVSTSAYNDVTLTTFTNISSSGITKFGCREGHDGANSEITKPAVDRIVGSTADVAGTTQDPKLVVTYAATTTSTNPSLLLD